MAYRPGDIVVTLFPFADQALAKERPAVVCAGPWVVSDTIEICWVAMITTTELKGWRGDIEVPDIRAVGLPVPSIIRTLKIACIDTGAITKKLGSLDTETQHGVQDQIRAHLSAFP